MLGQRLNRDRYRRFALELYDRFLREEASNDFHRSRPFGLLTLKLHEASALAGLRREPARLKARKRIDSFLDDRHMAEEFFDCDIALADTLAAACLARAFPDNPDIRVAGIQRAVASFGQRILAVGDLNAYAAHYSSLGICIFLELAQLEGWLAAVRASDAFPNVFLRQREIISPTGQIPEFGDSNSQWNRRWLDFACLLEYAARLYDEPDFQVPIGKVLPPDTTEMPDDQLFRGYLLLNLPPR